MDGLLQELKRRNVFRVAGLYLVVAWLLMQVASLLENALKLPDWFDGLVTALVLLGFPIALILAWAFELTPDGVRLTPSGEHPTAPTAMRSRFDYVMVMVLLLVGGLIVADRLLPRSGGLLADLAGKAGPSTNGAAPTAATSPKASTPDRATQNGSMAAVPSVAVLPFVDLSPNKDQGYFSDGLAEEILNVLTRLPELRVAGRTSSFAFKGQNTDLREIAKSLNVNHILEGSVRRAGDQIRVTAQLIKASDGFHVFSKTYDRRFDDVFSIQDEISHHIAKALELRLTGAGRKRPRNAQAFDLYLQAREGINSRNLAGLQEAERQLDRALTLAPDYAPLYAAKAQVTLLLAEDSYGRRPVAEVLPQAKALIDQALAQDPDLAEGHAVMGLYLMSADGERETAIPSLRRALVLNPNLTDAKHWLAGAIQGPESEAMFEAIVARDPGFYPGVAALAQFYGNRGDRKALARLLERAGRIPGLEDRVTALRGLIEMQWGDLASAYRNLTTARDADPGNPQLKQALDWTLLALGENERVARNGTTTARIVALNELGRLDEALALAEGHRGTVSVAVAVIMTLTEAGRYKEAVSWLEDDTGAIDAARLRQFSDYNGMVLGYLVVAYRKLEQPQKTSQVLDSMRRIIAKVRSLGFAGAPVLWFTANYEALTGNTEEAVRLILLAVDQGLTAAYSKQLPPSLAALQAHKAIPEVTATLSKRLNAARAELGWPPLSR